MNNKGFQCVFVLISIIKTLQVSTVHVHVYNIKSNCTITNNPCLKLSDIVSNKRYFISYVELHLQAGNYELSRLILVENVRNFSIIGQHHRIATISCKPNRGQILITGSFNVRIANIMFTNCGAKYQKSEKKYKRLFSYMSSVIVYYACTSVHITNTKFQNSYGHSIIAVSMKGISVITNTSFFHSLSLNSTKKIIFAAILFDSTEFGKQILYNLEISLLLVHCTFYNLDGKDEGFPLQKSPYIIGTALTLIHSNKSSDGVFKVQILNSNFINCICYTGPLISLHYNHHKNMIFLLHNVTMKNNKVVILTNYKIFSLIELNKNRFHSHVESFMINDPPKHEVEFKHCLISSNLVAGNIIRYITSPTLNMYLTIDDCSFSYNEVVNTFMLMENILKLLTMKNSRYTYNKACKTSILSKIQMNVKNAVELKQLYMYQYSGNTCAFFQFIGSTDVIFMELNEFSFNSLYCNHFWIMNNHIILNENSVLNFSSNSVGKALIKIKHQSSFCTINGMIYFPLCPIQYVSYRGSLTKEFTSGKTVNFSLTFHRNTFGNNSIPNIIVGKSLKDCEWLPRSAFATLHPGIIAKRFVHFDHQITRFTATGYPYAGCLCYEQNETDCLTDEIVAVYPGQTVKIGFVIMDTDYDKSHGQKDESFLQGVLKNNSTCQMELSAGTSEYKETKSGNCLYFHYTIGIDQQLYRECAFIHYFQNINNTVILYNKYYVPSLACPPGFLFANKKCMCHPNLKKITKFPICDIDNQSILRPGNLWIAYSNVTNEIMYTLNCPIQYCSTALFYMKLMNPNQQCDGKREGLMCGKCLRGFSATFGSLRCKKCSNVWLAITIAIVLVGLLFMVVAFKVDLTNTNITGLILYANIISLNSFNIFECNIKNIPTSLAVIMLNKNTYGAKKGEANQKQQLSDYSSD